VVDRLFLTREERGDTQTDSACPQFGKADGICATARIGHLQIGFESAYFRDIHAQIAVPIDSIEGNIEVGIEYQHGRISAG
jgi:hypothetical protein